MANKDHHLKSALFLLELVVLLLFFGICGSVCASLFAKADQMGEESGSLSTAVLLAENIAEELKATPEDELPKTGAYEFYFDGDGNPIEKEREDGYLLKMQVEWKEHFFSAELSVLKKGEELCQFPVGKAVAQSVEPTGSSVSVEIDGTGGITRYAAR